MTQLVLTPEQTTAVANSKDGIQIVDYHGHMLGYLAPNPFTAEDIAEAQRRSEYKGPCRTTAQVLERLHSQESP